MDKKLFEAALTGDVQNLHKLLVENPLILQTVALASAGNPLHVASAYGHVDFVKEIIRLKPDFANEMNQDGFSPMHLASANGYSEIVRELLKVDRKLCHLQGRDKKTPLHCAAIKGRGDVLSEMLAACPDRVKDVTVQRETALHLAVKNNQFEAIRVLVEWIRDMKEENILNTKDEQGNTVLHLATWKKQRQVIELLLGNGATGSGLLEVNAINHSGLTALDVLLIFPSEAGDREIEEILRSTGARSKRDATRYSIPSCGTGNQIFVNSPDPVTPPPEACPLLLNNLVEYFKFKKDRDSPGETRNSLLVIAVLVATATFQVGMSPPGGVWQDNSAPVPNNSTGINNQNYEGSSVLGYVNVVAFGIFMVSNTIGFAFSLHMINILTLNFPLQLELQICMIAMLCTYSTAVVTLAPEKLKLLFILLTSVVPIVTAVLVKWAILKRLGKFVVNMIHTRLQILT